MNTQTHKNENPLDVTALSEERNPYTSPSIYEETLPAVPYRNSGCVKALMKCLESIGEMPVCLDTFIDTMLTFTSEDIVDTKEIVDESLTHHHLSETKKDDGSSIMSKLKDFFSSLLSAPIAHQEERESGPQLERYKFIQRACVLYLERFNDLYGMDPLISQSLIPSPHAPHNKFSAGTSNECVRSRLDTKYGKPKILTEMEKAALIHFAGAGHIIDLYEEAYKGMKEYLLRKLTQESRNY